MFLAYDWRTGELVGQVCSVTGDTVVIFSSRGYMAVDADAYKLVRVP